jgi:hypothetical protein
MTLGLEEDGRPGERERREGDEGGEDTYRRPQGLVAGVGQARSKERE